MKLYQSKVPTQPASNVMNISNFKGVNHSVTPEQIADNEASDILNMQLDTLGALEKRTGYKHIIDSLGSHINGMVVFKNTLYFAVSTKLYKLNTDNTTVEVYNGLNDSTVNFFIMNNNLYIMDGVHFLEYNGTTVQDMQSIAYIPTIYVSTPPSGGGVNYEDFNMIQPKFKISFSADGTSTQFILPFIGLTSIDKVLVNNVEDTTGTKDLINGKYVFTTAPLKGTNNVAIQATRTTADMIATMSEIYNCSMAELYGGSNDTRVFIWGNPNFPNSLYYSGLSDKGADPSYFPISNVQDTSKSEVITGLQKQYDSAVILSHDSLNYINYVTDSNGKGMFPMRPLNDTTGCIAPKSIQLLDNNVTFLSKNGVYELTQSNVREEKNVALISANVNPKLLAEPNLEKAISIDYQGKYILVVNGNAYIYDYRQQAWYIWDNIKGSLIEFNNLLYMGGNDGKLYQFYRGNEPFIYNDDGYAINAFWKSKAIAFGHEEMNKLVRNLYVTLKPNKHSSANFYYVSNQTSFPRNQENLPNYANFNYGKSPYNDRIFDAKSEFIDSVRVELFDYDSINYSLFSYLAEDYPTEFAMKVKAKKVIYYRFIVQNNKNNEFVGVNNFVLQYKFQNYRK